MRLLALALLLGLAAAARELKQGDPGLPQDVDPDDHPRWRLHPRAAREARA